MRVIDLLNKIANGEEVPKKIEYNDKIFIYDGFSYIYENKTFNEYNRIEEFISYSSNLNDEVEILEEEKKIPEKLENKIDTTFENYNYSERMRLTEMINKINEIIDYLDYLKKKENNI
jgi:hypothetical protein